MTPLVAPQPAPTASDALPVWPLVIQALAAYEAARPSMRRAPTAERLREELGRRLRGAPAVWTPTNGERP